MSYLLTNLPSRKEEEDLRSNSANPPRFTTVGIGIVASSTQIDSANAVVATG